MARPHQASGGVLAWLVLTAVMLAASAVDAQLRPGALRDLATGKILVAARSLPDPNFAETVVVLTDYGAEGAMGVILNRRTEVPVAKAFPHLNLPPQAVLYAGGPVATSGVLGLWRSSSRKGDSRAVVPDVQLVLEREPLEQLITAEAGGDRFRVYLGYAGWGPGQLDRETLQGSWHVFRSDSSVIFDPDPATLWHRQIKRSGERMARR